VSIDEAKGIASESLGQFSDKVKKYYDIQFMIKKKDEEGRKETKVIDEETTKEITIYEFPIMGYKNKTREGIVW
jgi:vacuolar-type H+-ATPase subunit H